MLKFNPVFVVLAAVLGVAACGSDNDSGGGDSGDSGGSGGSGGSGDSGGSTSGASGSASGGSSGKGGTGGSSGSGAEGGSSDTGGSSATGGSSGSSGSGDLATNAVDGCQTPDMLGCESNAAGPYHYQCNVNPDAVPPEDGCEGASDGVNWCCPDPMCSRAADFDASVCEQIDATKPHGYTCAADTPGLDACVGFAGGVYCCP